jgi:hypothetical protein
MVSGLLLELLVMRSAVGTLTDDSCKVPVVGDYGGCPVRVHNKQVGNKTRATDGTAYAQPRWIKPGNKIDKYK